MNEEIRKKTDEDWKTQVDKEKSETEEAKEIYHQPTFTIFLSSLSMQAMIAMGKLENPLTNKAETNYDQARFLIDTLEIIKEKTKGNLTPEEEKLLGDSLFNLRMIYIQEKEEKK
ncbi:MAG: DUF1844 domain-containing protein [Candidatus Omnitrophica bacterium]|nr:DUF1844 domain-containing protein [Candidatus Omnitrophota bacterium]MBU0879072.1 DUF1844 domain-containing protein [Candidatus Omnitrophota bacterium]MBU0897227.1 DUF1844 domain-containing protein [Candidatus Omnitrophota bacterium]MBU1134733.1 DUF1844 domain-containing protein [Candidatus Omnitrophota bacterium]MBU1366743.1 DUF1844 domain-containing protein [Candidatus Omnitrophota bacterium]